MSIIFFGTEKSGITLRYLGNGSTTDSEMKIRKLSQSTNCLAMVRIEENADLFDKSKKFFSAPPALLKCHRKNCIVKAAFFRSNSARMAIKRL